MKFRYRYIHKTKPVATYRRHLPIFFQHASIYRVKSVQNVQVSIQSQVDNRDLHFFILIHTKKDDKYEKFPFLDLAKVGQNYCRAEPEPIALLN